MGLAARNWRTNDIDNIVRLALVDKKNDESDSCRPFSINEFQRRTVEMSQWNLECTDTH